MKTAGPLIVILTLGAASAACRRPPSPTPSVVTVDAHETTDAGASWGSDAATRTAAASSTDASPPATTTQPTSCPRYAPSMARARSATTTGNYVEAIAAFDEALRARPFDARAYAERGYAEHLARRDPRISFAVARSLTKDRGLLATIWFNEAETDARDGKLDDARLHYAVSASLGHPLASTKLAGRSTCTATWTTTGVGPLPFVRGWRAVLDALAPAVCGEQRTPQTTEAAAQREACRSCASLADPLDNSACTGPGPWSVNNGHMHCHGFTAIIQPIGDNRFIVQNRADGTGDAYLKTADGFQLTSATASLASGLVAVPAAQMAGEEDEQHCKPDVTADVDLDFPQHCGMGEALPPVVGPDVATFWDEKGRGRIAVTAIGAMPAVTFAGKTARIIGGGCDETVKLP